MREIATKLSRSFHSRLALFALLFFWAFLVPTVVEPKASNSDRTKTSNIEGAPASGPVERKTSSTVEPKASSSKVLEAVYEGIINPVAAEFLGDAIVRARESEASALVIRLDTPGGLDSSMRIIIKDISASPVPVLVYIAPTGARAASAGVFITLASHLAAMAPGTNIGAAHPVAMGGEMDEEMKKKVENDAAAYIKSIAEKRGRNTQWAEDAVRKSVSVTEREAVRLKVVETVAENLDALLKFADGRKVSTVSGTVTLRTAGAQVERIEMGLRLRILRALSDPNVAYILMMIGIYGLIFELSNPGSILPGVVGAICLILAFYSFQTLPINYAGLLLILFGVILFVAEIKVPSYGLLTVGGIVAMVLGSLMLVRTGIPFMRISLAVILPSILATIVFVTAVTAISVRAHRKAPISGIEGLIGTVGTARTKIDPRGKVFVHGELWDARSDETIQEGEPVEVVGIEGLQVRVRRPKSGEPAAA